MQPVIRFENVTKRFGRQMALDGVSFDVPAGTVFALLGENGAGKTTAIKIMLGLSEQDAGTVSVLEQNSRTDGLKIRQRVGYVAERPTLYDWMTVDELGWFTAGFYDAEFLPRFQQLAADFRLPPHNKLKTLSKGMKAKVALSLALALDPALPVSVNQLFWTKVFFAAASNLCLAPPLCLFVAMLPSDDYSQAYEYGELVAAATVATDLA